jgi:hypothetical protein
MAEINSITNWILLLFVLGGGARISYCLIMSATDADAADTHRKRARNTAAFTVIASCAWGISSVVLYYFG